MSSQLIKQMSKNAKKKQLIELKLNEKELAEVDASVSKAKRKSDRIAEKTKTKSVKPFGRDNVRINGLPGTLGDNLLRLGSEIVVSDKKSQYFSYLSRNCIIDITNNKNGSQISLLGTKIQSYFNKYKYTVEDTYNLKYPFTFDKVDTNKSLKKKYRQLDRYPPKNKKEVVLKKICVHILYQCAYLPHSYKYFNKCSEQTLLVRYWGNIFEYFFIRQNKQLIQW